MKRFAKIVFFISLLVIISSLPLLAAHAAPLAAPGTQDAPPAEPLDFDSLTKTWLTLTGMAGLFSGIINALKNFPKAKPWLDTNAPYLNIFFNIGGLLFVTIMKMTGQADVIPAIDTQAGLLAVVLSTIVAYVYQLLATRLIHEKVLAGMPIFGKSFSGRVAGQNVFELTGTVEREDTDEYKSFVEGESPYKKAK